MLDELAKPASLHVLLAHLPIVGLAAGAIALLVAFIWREHVSQAPALVVIFLMSVASIPAYYTGQQSYTEMRQSSDNVAADWLDEHMDRADRTIGTFCGLAAISLVALVLPVRWPRLAPLLGGLTLFMTLAVLALAIYVAIPGYRIRHTSFRPVISAPSLPLPGEHELGEGTDTE